MEKLIISVALVGAEISKSDFDKIPSTPDEIANAAKEAVDAGASIIHLHVRDENDNPSQDIEIFKEVTEKIKRLCNPIIQYSTGGAVGTPAKARCAPLNLKPDMATLSMGTMNFGDEVFENTSEIITQIAQGISENNIMPELEIFDLGMLESVPRYLNKGLIPKKYHMDFVLGVPGGASGDIRNLIQFVDRIHPDQTWTVAGIGRFQLPLSTLAIIMGGHVRVGFEDNIYYKKGELAQSNAQFVARIKKLSLELGREVATPEEARKILSL